MTTAASVQLKGYPRLKFRRCLLCLYLVLLQFAAGKNATGTDDALTLSEKGDANFAMEWGFLKTRNGFEKIDRVIISTEKNAKESNNHHDDTENPNLTYLAEEKNQKNKSAMEWLMETVTYVVCVLSLAGILLLNILFLIQDLLAKNGLSKVTSQNWSNLSSSSQMTIVALALLLFHVPVGGDVTGMSASKGTYFQNEAQGRYLQDYAIESFYDISMFQCQIQCVNRLPKCRSMNYIENEDGSSICKINKESQYCALPGKYILRKKSLYLETMPETDDEVWCSTCNYSGVIVKTNEQPGFTCSCKEGFYGDRCQHTGNPDYDASKTVYYKTSDGWILVARYSNNDNRNWINVTGHWWYDKVSSSGAVLDPSENNDMISQAFWTIGGTELKISRSDDNSHTALLQTTSNCLQGRTMREKITSYGNFQNGSSWAKDLCRGKCQVSYGGNYSSTAGFKKHSCSSDILNSNYIGFWCHWSADAAIIMIGGGGSACDRADHGIGITEQDSARFVESKPLYQDDFGFYQPTGTGVPQVTSYSLNLWVH